MLISKKSKYSAINEDVTLQFLKRKNVDIVENENGNGYITVKDISVNEQIPKNSNTSNFTYNLFTARTHYETNKEIYANTTTSSQSNIDELYKATFNLEYNFLIRKFEDYVSRNRIPELNLPNFYDSVNNELIRTPLTPFDSVDVFERNLDQKYKSTPLKTAYKSIVYNSNIEVLVPVGRTSTVAKQKFYIGDYFNKYNGFKEQFPVYADIKFDNEPIPANKQSFAKIFHEYNLYDEALIFFKEKSTLVDYTFLEGRQTQINFPKIRKIYEANFDDFINQAVIRGIRQPEKLAEIISKIKSISDERSNKINFKDMLMATECYQEVIGYKLSKYDTLKGNSPVPLQEWYLPNTTFPRTEFVDTQVIYDKRYKYTLSLIVLAIGSNYTYNSISGNKVEYSMTPIFRVYEIPSTEYENTLLDSPPLEPEVELIPYVGVADKIKINVNTSVGRKEVIPFGFDNNELKKFNKFKDSQNRRDNKIMFQSDEPNQFFEMYMLEEAPKNYYDFIKGKKVTILNNNSSAGATEAILTPNKVYYFTFRGFDYHGNFSNPTVVYTAELVNDSGAIYPIFGIYDFNKDEKREPVKTLERFLSVQPSIYNTLFDPEKNNFDNIKDPKLILNAIKIGTNYPGVWGKRVKLRLTSTSSGKKIDINVLFDINKEKI